ncbi:MAG: methyl-accepting chemotaxis protein [Lacrimispora sp.]|uniref:HAMP domain-containing methyl-accepting chemotaxis protein n=1 Tax=Lacrimispora sp. TaxID=2719234 RepID=UPI0039E7159E
MKIWFSNAKIRVKIISGFLIVTLIAGLVGGLGIASLSSVSTSYGRAYSDTVKALQHSEKISSSFQEIRANLFEMVLAESGEDKKSCISSIEQHRDSIYSNLEQYKVLMGHHTPEESAEPRRLVAEVETDMAAFDAKATEIMNGIGMEPTRRRDAFAVMSDGGELHTLSQTLETAIAAFIDYNATYTEIQIAANRSRAIYSEILMAIGIAIGLLVAVLIGLFIARGLSKRIEKIVDVYGEIAKGNKQANVSDESRDELGRMAGLIRQVNSQEGAIVEDIIRNLTKISEGDLRIQAETDYPGDFAAIRQAIETTAAALNETMQTIDTAADQVAVGSGQVSSGAQALAAGSTEQAASVEELSSAVERVAEQAAENTAAVNTAVGYFDKAAVDFATGIERMEQLTEAMDEISSSSNQIVSVTKVIEDIAFQTNILALNAAIEAARAGNAGKGFTVVADEVRNLAAKSAEAARQTGELIQTAVATVNKGTEMTGETAQILKDVVKATQEVSRHLVQIKQASGEQSDAIEQIKDGLSQVSAVVQTNAATAEENSATSEEMSAQAITLRDEVGKFKLSEQAVI